MCSGFESWYDAWTTSTAPFWVPVACICDLILLVISQSSWLMTICKSATAKTHRQWMGGCLLNRCLDKLLVLAFYSQRFYCNYSNTHSCCQLENVILHFLHCDLPALLSTHYVCLLEELSQTQTHCASSIVRVYSTMKYYTCNGGVHPWFLHIAFMQSTIEIN